MSADNWRQCPKCIAKLEQDKQAAFKEIGESYGKVSPEEWMKKQKQIESKFEEEVEDNLREDYELHVNTNGEFYVSYHCRCTQCGFKFSFKHQQKVDLEAK